MDLEALIIRLTLEIQRHLQSQNDQQKILVLASRSESTRLHLPAELHEDLLVFCDDPNQPSHVARRIIPFLTIAQLDDMAQGRAVDPVARILLDNILAGRSIEVLRYEYTLYRESAPSALFALYEAQARQLAVFGIRPYAQAQDAAAVNPKLLITERDILEIIAKGASRYRLARGCRITPLAADCARDNHLLLEQE